jgi:multiple antibiotic resistance protein
MDLLQSLYHWGAFPFFVLLDISLDAFRIAGGILLTIVAIEMLHGNRTRTEMNAEDEKHYREKDDLSIVPLGIPILAGPGALHLQQG